MRNRDRWQPTKYLLRLNRLVATSDVRELAVSSRLSAGLVANCYLNALKQHASGRLLDLGCGKAPLYGAYASLVDDVVCVDWPKSLHGSSYLDLACDISKPLPFFDSSFDTIVLSSVLEHVPTPDRLWEEMARVLAPGGVIIMNSPFLYAIHEAPNDYYRFTEYALLRSAENAGLQVAHIDATGGAIEVLADTLAKTVASHGFAGKTMATLVQWSAAMFARTPWGRKVRASTSRRFPLSYFLVVTKPEPCE